MQAWSIVEHRGALLEEDEAEAEAARHRAFPECIGPRRRDPRGVRLDMVVCTRHQDGFDVNWPDGPPSLYSGTGLWLSSTQG
jgi:hypothetical protein